MTAGFLLLALELDRHLVFTRLRANRRLLASPSAQTRDENVLDQRAKSPSRSVLFDFIRVSAFF
jgi:hypothetical protein